MILIVAGAAVVGAASILYAPASPGTHMPPAPPPLQVLHGGDLSHQAAAAAATGQGHHAQLPPYVALQALLSRGLLGAGQGRGLHQAATGTNSPDPCADLTGGLQLSSACGVEAEHGTRQQGLVAGYQSLPWRDEPSGALSPVGALLLCVACFRPASQALMSSCVCMWLDT
jgi:hypothetical protein